SREENPMSFAQRWLDWYNLCGLLWTLLADRFGFLHTCFSPDLTAFSLYSRIREMALNYKRFKEKSGFGTEKMLPIFSVPNPLFSLKLPDFDIAVGYVGCGSGTAFGAAFGVKAKRSTGIGDIGNRASECLSVGVEGEGTALSNHRDGVDLVESLMEGQNR